MKSLIFKPELAQAIYEGRCTQTRRIIKPQPRLQPKHHPFKDRGYDVYYYKGCCYAKSTLCILLKNKSPFQVSHKFYVKERYAFGGSGVFYSNQSDGSVKIAWSNPMFMPERYARSICEVTGVRVERLQEISISDCVAEGIQRLRGPLPPCPTTAFKDYMCQVSECGATASFRGLWDSINKKYSWDSNPFCWVYEFSRNTVKKGE